VGEMKESGGGLVRLCPSAGGHPSATYGPAAHQEGSSGPTDRRREMTPRPKWANLGQGGLC
jgi:hypothetical protein